MPAFVPLPASAPERELSALLISVGDTAFNKPIKLSKVSLISTVTCSAVMTAPEAMLVVCGDDGRMRLTYLFPKTVVGTIWAPTLPGISFRYFEVTFSSSTAPGPPLFTLSTVPI